MIVIGGLAEGKGFEPLRPCGLPVFKTGAISQAPPPLRVSARHSRRAPTIAARRPWPRAGCAFYPVADSAEYSF
jgi:hypothetical protein